MEPTVMAKRFADRFGAAVLEQVLDVKQPWIKVDPNHLLEIAQFARDGEEIKFDFLRSIAAVDYIKENEIELVYLLFSYRNRHEFKIKVRLPRENPSVHSVETVWPAANWHEREQHELFGIRFENHSDLRNLLLPEDWVGFPLRKDYKEQEEYNGVSTRREYLTGMPDLPTLPVHPGK